MATYHNDGFYYAYKSALSTPEMETNARYIVNFFRGKGWSDNAIAGMLGNFQSESTINPARWENNTDYRAKGTKNKGLGLAQWTPWTKYTNWCEDKGYDEWHMWTACHRIWTEFENVGELSPSRYGGGQYFTNPSTDDYHFSLTRAQFIKSTLSARELAVIFVRNYERPGSIVGSSATAATRADTYKKRGDNGERWWNFIQNNMQGTGTVDPPYTPSEGEETVINKTMYCNVESGEYVNIRSGPSTSDSAIGKLYRGNAVFVVSTSGQWAKINSPTEGYVMVSFLQDKNPVSGNDTPTPVVVESDIIKFLTIYKGRRYRVVR